MSTPPNSGKETGILTASDDVQIAATNKVNLQCLDFVLQHLHVKHVVKGNGSYFYHAISHQARLIPSISQSDEKISSQLRNLALHMMWDHPDVCTETDMSFLQLVEKRQVILNHDSWGGDLGNRLIAIGLQRGIIAVTALCDGSTYA